MIVGDALAFFDRSISSLTTHIESRLLPVWLYGIRTSEFYGRSNFIAYRTYLSVEIIGDRHYKVIIEFGRRRLRFFTYKLEQKRFRFKICSSNVSLLATKLAKHFSHREQNLTIPEIEKFEKPVSPRPEVIMCIEVNGVSYNRSIEQSQTVSVNIHEKVNQRPEMDANKKTRLIHLPDNFSYLLILYRRLGPLRCIKAVVVARALRGAVGFIRFSKSATVPLILAPFVVVRRPGMFCCAMN